MEVIRQLVGELTQEEKNDLKSRVDREFAHVPIVREHVWAEPRWILRGMVEGKLVSFLNVVDRIVLVDGMKAHFFGLNNVITEPEYRGKGYSTALNRAALDFMAAEDPAATGFLFCADDLIPFYRMLGWTKFSGEVTVSQPTGDKLWPSNAMYFNSTPKTLGNSVHLQGPPW